MTLVSQIHMWKEPVLVQAQEHLEEGGNEEYCGKLVEPVDREELAN